MPVSQEVHFAHHLAANEKITRDRAVRKLTKWIRAKSARQDTEFTEESLMKLWKGLFFCMWMSDKPFVQQELANSIANLIQCFARRSQSLIFVDTFFKTMAHEWFAIDRYRLDKFMMLVRRFFRQALVLAHSGEWKDENIVEFCDTLKATALHPNNGDIPLGLKMHVVDVYLQELARVHGGELTPDQAMLFLEPFFNILATSSIHSLVEFVRNNVFFLMIDLDREALELGQEEEVVVRPKGGEEGEESEEDEYDEHGRVLEKGETTQDLPAIPFDYEKIAQRLFECTKLHTLKPANRAVITRLVKKFWSVIKGGLLKPPVVEESDSEDGIPEKEIDAAARRLEKEHKDELRLEKEELRRLKQERSKAAEAKFGFDSGSGTYQFHCSNGDSSADSSSGGESDVDTDKANDEGERKVSRASKRARNRKRQKGRNLEADEVSDSDTEAEEAGEASNLAMKKKAKARRRVRHGATPNEGAVKAREVMRAQLEEDAEAEIAALLTNKMSNGVGKRKHISGATGVEHFGSEEQQTPKMRKRRRKKKKNAVRIANGEDQGCTIVLEDERREEKAVGALLNTNAAKKKESALHAKKPSLIKKADKLVLGKAPRKKKLRLKKASVDLGLTPSGTLQTELPGASFSPPNAVRVHGAEPSQKQKVKKKRVNKQTSLPSRFTATSSPEKSNSSPNATKLSDSIASSVSSLKAVPQPQVLPSGSELSPEANGKTKFAQFEMSTPTATFFRRCVSKVQSEKPKGVKRVAPPASLSLSSQGEKRVNFVLSKNRAQDPREYFETLKNSPEIPFDAAKKPIQGVLKTRHSLPNAPGHHAKRSRASDFF